MVVMSQIRHHINGVPPTLNRVPDIETYPKQKTVPICFIFSVVHDICLYQPISFVSIQSKKSIIQINRGERATGAVIQKQQQRPAKTQERMTLSLTHSTRIAIVSRVNESVTTNIITTNPCRSGYRRNQGIAAGYSAVMAEGCRQQGTTVPCRASASNNETDQDEGIHIEIAVSGMMCDGCTSRIQDEIGKKDRVISVHADLDSGIVAVTVSVDNFGDAAEIMESLVDEINGMGFEAQPRL